MWRSASCPTTAVGLRAGDALHLAIASNNAVRGIYSLDRTMVAAGLALGLPMNAGFSAMIRW